jgi:hypothetical protein
MADPLRCPQSGRVKRPMYSRIPHRLAECLELCHHDSLAGESEVADVVQKSAYAAKVCYQIRWLHTCHKQKTESTLEPKTCCESA